MRPFLVLTLNFCIFGLSACILICLERMRRGPTLMDRILAFDTICVMIVGLMVVISMRWKSADYLDLILVFTLLGFFTTVAFALYLHRSYAPHAIGEGKPRRHKKGEA